MVDEALLTHDGAAVDVAAIEDDRGFHLSGHLLEVWVFKFCPVGANDEGVGIIEGGHGVGGVGDFVCEDILAGFVCDGVIGGDGCAAVDEFLHEGDGRSHANVVCAWFEGDTPDGDFEVFEVAIEVLIEFGEECVTLVGIDFVDGFEELSGVATVLSHGDHGEYVFGETGAAIAEARVEELVADA